MRRRGYQTRKIRCGACGVKFENKDGEGGGREDEEDMDVKSWGENEV